MRWRSHKSKAGFTLVETLVALSLLGVAMLLTLSLIFQEPRALSRLAAHEQAMRALEQTLESIRAGRAVPLGKEVVDPEWLLLPEDPAARDLKIWSERQAESGSGLYRLTLTARYRVARRWYTRSIDTLVWYP